MTNKIDWNAPLEAYHPDGRVEPVTARKDFDGDYTINKWLDVVHNTFSPDGSHYANETEWRIRNVRTEKPALTEEMVWDAICLPCYVPTREQSEAKVRVINLLREHGVLAEVVDPDEVLAREIKEYLNPQGDEQDVQWVAAAIKRVRAEKG